MRVLSVTNLFPTEAHPGETPSIKDQVDALQERGIDVDVLLVDRYRGKLGYADTGWHVFRAGFSRKQYDLIHAYYGLCGALARLQVVCPVIVSFRGSDLLSGRDGWIGRIVAKLVDGVIVMSDEMATASGRDDARVIPFGVNTKYFHPRPRDEVRSELNIPLDKHLVLFPWDPRRPEKRFDVAQQATHILGQHFPQLELVAIHNETHETVAKYMNACDALVLVSEYEGAPMAVREAMACNLPIVSVDVGDVRQVIGNTEGCYLCDRDPMDVADRLRRVLESRKRTLGFPRMAEQDVGWSADRVLEVYERVLK